MRTRKQIFNDEAIEVRNGGNTDYIIVELLLDIRELLKEVKK